MTWALALTLLWTTLATAADPEYSTSDGQATAMPDSVLSEFLAEIVVEARPKYSIGLRELLDLQFGPARAWPRARGELTEILASRLRIKAALRDTVSALNTAHRDTVAQVAAERNAALVEVEHLQLREEWRKSERPGWFDRLWAKWGPAICAAIGVFVGAAVGGVGGN